MNINKKEYRVSQGMIIANCSDSDNSENHRVSFESIGEYLVFLENNPNIVIYSIYFGEYVINSELPKLPEKIQILSFSYSKIDRLPEDLPKTLREIRATNSHIRILPDLRQHYSLEYLDLCDNRLETLDASLLSPNLRTLILDFNKLRRIDGGLPPELTHLSLQYNKFDIDPIVPPGCHVSRYHMYSDEYEFALMRERHNRDQRHRPTLHNERLTINNNIENTIYKNRQNVHNHSVQNAVSSSVEQLLALTKDKQIPLVNDILDNLYACKSVFHHVGHIFCIECNHTFMRKRVAEWCEDTCVSTKHGISFRELLRLVYCVIRDHQYKETLVVILRGELEASIGYCFTGKIARLINVLTGFIDNVGVTISPQEQMQGRIAAVIKGRENNNKSIEEVRKQVEMILDEFNIVDAFTRASWIDAIE